MDAINVLLAREMVSDFHEATIDDQYSDAIDSLMEGYQIKEKIEEDA